MDSPEELPAPPPRALPAPDDLRESARVQGAIYRAFLDACNAPETVDGVARSREVVAELGAKREQMLALGAALLDAGCTVGSPFFTETVNVLRDRDVFRAIYSRRKCAAACKIHVGELVYQGSLALKQALNAALARLPGRTLLLVPQAGDVAARRNDARRRQAGEIRDADMKKNTDGPSTARRVML